MYTFLNVDKVHQASSIAAGGGLYIVFYLNGCILVLSLLFVFLMADEMPSAGFIHLVGVIYSSCKCNLFIL